MAAATTAAATAAAPGGGRRGLGRGSTVAGGEDGELDGGLRTRAVGAGDLLLLVDDNPLEAGVAVVAKVFVDGHGANSLSALPMKGSLSMPQALCIQQEAVGGHSPPPPPRFCKCRG